ncbi:catechol 2,3-dioxygenase-like lactoylglutathione lyase family enzyme [Pseudonocardia sediminis]|uniref:Catechol 2,3-dioxygenase-like lactoylglutathione lyase family enzyme n=1 Tax=Pseudonocardia sediminis TaxID=1397368 RepID=A0A4Q7UNI0_PSEST|nr:VOC family protein [Pseudonocardia sediminis]RZT83262.1 catechol 2,3-dioxygenase-like lactoylglutathione lyase family enzyme [Pseudonocardia sediminis]
MTFSAVAHVAIVVRDMAASIAWYERVLGFERSGEAKEGPPEAGHPRQLLKHPDSGFVLGIHEPHRRSDDLFDPSRTGLDHVAVHVSERADLDAWSARFDELGVEHSPVRDAGYAEFVSVFDPDRIAWELWWAKPS